MTAVTSALLGAEASSRDLERIAVSLPVVDATGERDDVLVAELLERAGRERRAVARRTVGDDRLPAVGRGALDPRLEPAARDVDCAWDVALVPLLALADVQED